MLDALRSHWPEYSMEALGLGLFMLSAATFATIVFHPTLPVHAALPGPLQRVLMGAFMGLTAIGLIYSPWGRRSGAHYNPALTATFYRLGKVRPWDAVFYVIAQFAGGALGLLFASIVLGRLLSDPMVDYVKTVPGPQGAGLAFLLELGMAAGLMYLVLQTTNRPRLMRYTGVFAGCLIAVYICTASSISGMSINPARTVASASLARDWSSIWIYFTAPPLGMLLAAETYLRTSKAPVVMCAKLHHDFTRPCIFRCGYAALQQMNVTSPDTAAVLPRRS